MNPAKRRNFERLLNPRQIAFIGGADAAVAIGEARRAGFAGTMWAVNPKRSTLAGLSCVADLDDLPDAPDAVFLAIPAPGVPDALLRLRKMGAGGVVCYSAGFGEAHDEGRDLEQALRASIGDMALIGPNCYGLINYVAGSALWPFAHGGSCPGYGAVIITQSGMFSSDITMSQRSLPLAYMISTGNQADLELADYLELMSERPEVRAIGLHIEGLADVAAFERAALKVLAAGTPIVAFKTGTSEIGEQLTLSHTGSMAGSTTLYEALFRRTGIISVNNPSQFLETLKFLCVAGVPRGRRVAGFTCSGGGATMLADHGARIGLELPAFDTKARASMAALLPPIATVSNPLDYTTPIWGQPDKTAPVFKAALEQLSADATVLVQDYPAAGLDEMESAYLADGLAFAEAARAADRPSAICATLPENLPQHIRERFIDKGVAPMQGIQETLNAIRDAAGWHASHARLVQTPPAPLVVSRPGQTTRLLSEAEGKARLAAAGLPVPEGRLVCSDDLRSAAEEIGFPVAIKMMSDGLAHKTEAGAVRLGLTSPASVIAAAEEMRSDVARYRADAVTDLFLIERMASKPLLELVVAIRRDPQFGQVLTLGSGGVLIELLGDSATLLMPVTPDDIIDALLGLRSAPLFDGFRGAEAVDLPKLSRAIAMIVDFALVRADDIAEIEINPLFVYKDSIMIVDVLMQESMP